MLPYLVVCIFLLDRIRLSYDLNTCYKSVVKCKMIDGIFLFRCTYLYDILRPRLIYEGNIDSLCELVDILKVEVLGEQLSRRGESVAGLGPILHRILADVHERLAFCARTHIREEVVFYMFFC
jgi:hypothetical protein